jgi:hypothetical protein
MATNLVVDTNSILDFTKFYTFDIRSDKKIYRKLTQFILSKIKSNEIIIIDKVFNEIYSNKYTEELKERIKPYVEDTLFLFHVVEDLIDKYYIASNEKFCNNDENEIELELKHYSEEHADLYLIAYCNYLKQKGIETILITEETRNEDKNKKLIKKIPTICVEEKIKFEKLPYSLFEHYKNELKFDLEIK